MYESPINLIVSDITTKVNDEMEHQVFTAIQHLGIDVNKEELVKALNYDRDQYRKGYEDGYNDATRKFLEGESE